MSTPTPEERAADAWREIATQREDGPAFAREIIADAIRAAEAEARAEVGRLRAALDRALALLTEATALPCDTNSPMRRAIAKARGEWLSRVAAFEESLGVTP